MTHGGPVSSWCVSPQNPDGVEKKGQVYRISLLSQITPGARNIEQKKIGLMIIPLKFDVKTLTKF